MFIHVVPFLSTFFSSLFKQMVEKVLIVRDMNRKTNTYFWNNSLELLFYSDL